jgi:hypothetical protein
MTRRYFVIVAAVVIVGALRAWPGAPDGPAAGPLPERLSDRDFWKLSTQLSEPDGYFRSENLVSNETAWPAVLPDLARVAKPRRAYLGVGPEQNYTYIAALSPAIAFVVDIRRGNLQLHLMYKALFELSADRGEFVSRLFSLRRPAGLSKESSATEILGAYSRPGLRSETLFKTNLAAIVDLYEKHRRIPLRADDVKGMEGIYREFFEQGLSIQYAVTPSRQPGMFPTYLELMTAGDGVGGGGFLGTEQNFRRVKALHARNLIVPVVGNFAGPKAVRSVGKYLKSRNTLVGAFYLSNVEQYLRREGSWATFCANAATLPLDNASVFIRSERGSDPGVWYGSGGVGPGPPFMRAFGPRLVLRLGNIGDEVRACGQ